MEGLKTNSHPPLEGSEGKKKSQDGEKRACVWWRRRGRGKGCKAVSRAAAAGGSPREEEVRAGPGGSSASQGRRRRTLHSHRELRAVAAGRHTLARRARLSVGAAGCARLRRRPGPSRCAPLRSKLLWGPLGNCRRTAPCGWGASRLWPRESRNPFPPPPLCLKWAIPGNLGGVVGAADSGWCAEKGGDPEPQTQPRRRPGTG